MEELEHHKQQDFCTNRPQYRQGRKLTAVKVYTPASESRHLLIVGVPDLKLRAELKAALSKFGRVDKLVELPDYAISEEFTKVYHTQYKEIRNSRFAKRKLDATSFYGGVLHVCYAPEMESVDEVREKLEMRRNEVMERLRKNSRIYVPRPKSETMSVTQQSQGSTSTEANFPVQRKEVYGPQLPKIPPPKVRPKSGAFIPRQVNLKRNLSAGQPSEINSNKKANSNVSRQKFK